MIDIVIPAYNAHKTMARCLASIMEQVNIEDINVIIVNDASKKDYSEFITAFSPFMRVKEVKMEKNGGPGTARRVGMQAGNAEYIIFIDADDTFYDSYSVKNLHRGISENNKDVVISTFVEETRDAENRVVFLPHVNDMIWVFGKIYRRAFLEKFDIEFNDTRANEDNGFNTVIQLLSDKVAFLENIATYHWHWNDNSITRNNDYAFNGMEGFIDNQIWAFEKVMQWDERNEMLTLDKMLKNFIMLYNYYCLFANTGRDVQKYLTWCRRYYNEVYLKILPKITMEHLKQAYTQCRKMTDFLDNIIPDISFNQFAGILAYNPEDKVEEVTEEKEAE